jgi:hypothetical protein
MLSVPKEWGANMAVRRKLLWDGAHVPGASDAIKVECSRNILFYVNAFCWTYDPRKPESPVIPFVTYEYQDEALLELVDAVMNKHDVGIMKSRDMGASWINLAVMEWFWHFKPMVNFLMVSRNEDLVDKRGDPGALFWKIDFLHKHQPKWLLPSRIVRTSMHMENGDNGSVIDGQSTTGDVGRGDRRTAALIDEFAAFDTQSGFEALKATRDMTRCRIFNSTPKGAANAFYEVTHKTKGVRIIRMHWSQHPEKNRGLYTSERDEKTGRFVLKRLDDFTGEVEAQDAGGKVKTIRFPEEYQFVLDGKVRSPWYDRECGRAVSEAEIGQELDIDFVGSDYKFFDPAALDRYERLYCRKAELEGEIAYDRETGRPREFSPVDGGPLKLWLVLGRGTSISRDRHFVVGADVAAGTGASNSALSVYEIETSEKVAEFVNPKILPADFAVFAVALCRFFNNALLVPDRSGPTGEVFVQKVLSLGYARIFQRRNEKKVTREVVQEYGLWLNPAMKTAVLEQYRAAIGDGKIVNRSLDAIKECRQFIRTMNGAIEHQASAYAHTPDAARTAHGDIVIADALAWQGLVAKYETPDAEEPEIPAGSLAERMAERRREEAERKAAEAQGEGWGDGSDVGWGDGTEAGW